MSRSERIFERRNQFRDHVGLVDSGFRILLKPELEQDDRLERQLERLADSHPDTLKLARFFAALESGIAAASARTLEVMRRLKLSDIAQIQQLLLDVEDEPTGSYLVDVFDRVLQHEIERDGDIIDAARALNDFKPERHPPAYVAGSPQLQDVVQRTLTQNAERLRLAGSVGSRVTFGDVLRYRQKPGQGDQPQPAPMIEAGPDQVLLVLTPICDLQRGAAPRILLMIGDVRPLERTDWTYGPDARTPSIKLGDELMWVKWNLKHIDTVLGTA